MESERAYRNQKEHIGSTQQNMQNSQNEQNSPQVTGMQLGSSNNGVAIVNNSPNAPSSSSTSGTPIVGLLHQNSMNSRQENQMNCLNSLYGGGNPVQIPSAGSSNSIPLSQPNPSSPFSPASTSNNNMVPTIHNSRMNSVSSPPNMPAMHQPQPTSQPREPDPDSQSSVQQIYQDLMMSSQLNGVSALGNDMKSIASFRPGLNGGNCLVGNGTNNSVSGNSGVVGGIGFGSMGGIGPSIAASGLRASMSNNPLTINGRVGMNHMPQDPSTMSHQQQQDLGNRLLGGLGSVNSFSNLQFDWMPSP